MKRIKILIGSGLLVACLFVGFTDDGKAQFAGKIEGIKTQLAQIEKKYIAQIGFQDRRDAIGLMNKVIAELDELARGEVPVTQAPLKAVSAADFDLIVKSIGAETNTDKKKFLILRAGVRVFFLVDQVAIIMGLFTWDNDRLEIVEALLPRIVDREKAYKLFDQLTFNDARTKLKAILDGHQR